MTEQDFGRQIRKALDLDLPLDADTDRRLSAARNSALARYRVESPSATPAWVLRDTGPGTQGPRSYLPRFLIPALVLSVGLVIVNYWYQAQISQDLVQIDAAVLTGDLPIDAYLDTGFNAWLKRSSAE